MLYYLMLPLARTDTVPYLYGAYIYICDLFIIYVLYVTCSPRYWKCIAKETDIGDAVRSVCVQFPWLPTRY